MATPRPFLDIEDFQPISSMNFFRSLLNEAEKGAVSRAGEVLSGGELKSQTLAGGAPIPGPTPVDQNQSVNLKDVSDFPPALIRDVKSGIEAHSEASGNIFGDIFGQRTPFSMMLAGGPSNPLMMAIMLQPELWRRLNNVINQFALNMFGSSGLSPDDILGDPTTFLVLQQFFTSMAQGGGIAGGSTGSFFGIPIVNQSSFTPMAPGLGATGPPMNIWDVLASLAGMKALSVNTDVNLFEGVSGAYEEVSAAWRTVFTQDNQGTAVPRTDLLDKDKNQLNIASPAPGFGWVVHDGANQSQKVVQAGSVSVGSYTNAFIRFTDAHALTILVDEIFRAYERLDEDDRPATLPIDTADFRTLFSVTLPQASADAQVK